MHKTSNSEEKGTSNTSFQPHSSVKRRQKAEKMKRYDYFFENGCTTLGIIPDFVIQGFLVKSYSNASFLAHFCNYSSLHNDRSVGKVSRMWLSVSADRL